MGHINYCCQGQWFTVSEFSMESGQFLNRKFYFVENHGGGGGKVEGTGQHLLIDQFRLCLVRKG